MVYEVYRCRLPPSLACVSGARRMTCAVYRARSCVRSSQNGRGLNGMDEVEIKIQYRWSQSPVAILAQGSGLVGILFSTALVLNREARPPPLGQDRSGS